MRLLFTAFLALAIAGPAVAEPMRVHIDESKRLTLSSQARDVMVANPAVADVTMLDTRNLVILGKAYGMTHILVVDTAGRTIVDRSVVVVAPDQGQVSFYRGPELRTYACAPTCEPATRGGLDKAESSAN